MIPDEHVVDRVVPDTVDEAHDLLITVCALNRGATHGFDTRLAMAALDCGTAQVKRVALLAAELGRLRLNKLDTTTDLKMSN
jgi:hypothetical protein